LITSVAYAAGSSSKATKRLTTTTEATTEATTENVTESTTKKASKTTSKITTEVTTENTTEDITESTTKNSTEVNTKLTTEAVTNNNAEANTENISEDTTESTTTELQSVQLIQEQTIEQTTYLDPISGVVENAPPLKDIIPFTPAERSNTTENDDIKLTQYEVLFENGDYYWINRYEFKRDNDTGYFTSFNIPGNTIEIRYVDPETKQWVMTTNIDNIKKNTLFINTDKYNLVASVSAVYKNDFTSNTLQVLNEDETPIKITKLDGEYNLSFKFKQSTDNIGELWVLQSENPLYDPNDLSTLENLKTHDLGIERRWSYDGYYFPIPSNYVPTGENMLYRHPANYTGASWAKNSYNLLSKDLGYVMTNICAKNQNDMGYWHTSPKSLWLEADFNIKEKFYDTRFNTDFACSLVYAYQNYNVKEFLKSAVKYAEFFIEHAQNNHYETDSGGWLVEDYSSEAEHTRTHVSLNHQLSEINFLYELFNATAEKRYMEIADLMLLAIDDTKNSWVLPDNNLNYALMYTGTNNKMVDYPYLTYNDLFQTKRILLKYFNKTNTTIEYLMQCKKQWMDNNNITEYNK